MNFTCVWKNKGRDMNFIGFQTSIEKFISNKIKGRISKRVFQENRARQIFLKTNISYPLIRTRTWKKIMKKYMKPGSEKKQKIYQTHAPENKKALQSFMRLCNYMKNTQLWYTNHLRSITDHLRELHRKEKDYLWTETHELAFKNLF